jgi:membrane-bound lytic murein transglycosylase B
MSRGLQQPLSGGKESADVMGRYSVVIPGLRFQRIRLPIILLWAVLGIFTAAESGAGQWDPLMERLARDGFSGQWLKALFARSEARFDPSIMQEKMKTLYETKFGTEPVRRLQRRLAFLGYQPGPPDGKVGPKTTRAIRWFQKAQGLPVDGRPSAEVLQLALKEANKAPADMAVPPPRKGPPVYETIMTIERLAEARVFFEGKKEALRLLENGYGIPGEIAVGILTVETRLGTYLGEEKAFVTLASMASCDDFACVAPAFEGEPMTQAKKCWIERRLAQKARWAYHECKALLTYAEQSGEDPLSMPGSFYGAIGIAQFMPSNALRYGVDGNQDGVVNLFDLEDALFSMGSFLRANGWKGDMRSRRKQRRVIYNYNPSIVYVNTVMAVADYLSEG